MVVELISVGTELLLGNIVNTNTQFLAEKCALLGLTMYHQVTVGDNHDRLAEVIRTALKRSDVIILTGGLGPTEDDLTKEVCAEVMGFPLVEDKHTRERIEEYFRNNIYKVIPDNNWKQAIIPEGCMVLDNDNGTAPGLILEKYGKSAILLPGPPNELYPLFMNQVYPYLQKLQPDMIGIGPFITHQDTPFREFPAGSAEQTLYLLSLVRLMLPDALLPATTALGTLDGRGRQEGVLSGCNVVMPNLSPMAVRKKYLLYDHKAGTDDSGESSLSKLRAQMQEIGYTVAVGRGDFTGGRIAQ